MNKDYKFHKDTLIVPETRLAVYREKHPLRKSCCSPVLDPPPPKGAVVYLRKQVSGQSGLPRKINWEDTDLLELVVQGLAPDSGPAGRLRKVAAMESE